MTDSFDNEINERIKALAVSMVNSFKSANPEVELEQQIKELFDLVKYAQLRDGRKIKGEFELFLNLPYSSATFWTKVWLCGNSSPDELLNIPDVIKFDFSDRYPNFPINFVLKIIPMLLNRKLPWEFFNINRQDYSFLFFRLYREECQMELPSKEFIIDPNSPSDDKIFWGFGDGKLYSRQQ